MIIVQLDSEQLSNLIQNAVRKVMGETPTQASKPEPEILLTVQDAADFLSLSVPTIYTLISKGEIPTMKRSKRCYFSKVELMNYLKAGRKQMAIQEESEKPKETLVQKKECKSKIYKK